MPYNTPRPVDPELLEKLPRTFLPVLNDQLQEWDQLFPAEQRPIRASMDYLNSLPAEDFRKLLEPIFELESKMDLSAWGTDRQRFTIRDTGILARSPHYPQWRIEVQNLFAHLDEATAKAGDIIRDRRKLVVNIIPAGLPIRTRPLWPRLAKHGHWVQLEKPSGEILGGLADVLLRRGSEQVQDPVEHTWILDAHDYFSQIPKNENLTLISYDALHASRLYFSRKLNEINKELISLDNTYTGLFEVDMKDMLEAPLKSDLRMREFIRQLYLSGNGAVCFRNSFVQWGASEALRRAQPQVMFCCFGIRNKMKPFSGLVPFEDQNRANPVKDAPDMEGSLIDIEVLGEYVYLSAERLPVYNGRTASLFAAADSDMLLYIAPEDFPSLPSAVQGRLGFDRLEQAALEWLSLT